MSLNLNTAAGFATATMSNAATLLTNLTGQSSWEILQSSYQASTSTKPVVFHVFQGGSNVFNTGITLQSPIATPVGYQAAVDTVQDGLARRISEYSYPYVDGQETDDLGREASTYEFDAIIFGPSYKNAYLLLLAELNKPVSGTLTHPVLGNLNVKFKSARVTYRSKERQAVTLHLVFVESNLGTSKFTASTPTLKSSLADAAAFISAVSTTITNVQGYATILSTEIAAVNATITAFTSGFSNFLVSLNVSFNQGTSADIPGLLPTSNGGTAYQTATATTGIYAGLSPTEVQASTSGTVTPAQAQVQLSSLFTSGQALISQIEAVNSGQGALIFYDMTNTIRQALLSAKSALVQCLQSSNSVISNYTTPQLMSIREVCFAVGLTPDDSQSVLTLNPTLLSVNYIPAGTVLQIPSS